MKMKKTFVLAAAINLSTLITAEAQNKEPHKHDHHHGHSHAVTVKDAEFKAKLPSSKSYVLVDVDLLSEHGETTVAFIRSLSPVASCKAFDTMGLNPHSTNDEDVKKAALHVLIHMGGRTKENVEWINTVVKNAKTTWHNKQHGQHSSNDHNSLRY